MCLGLNGAAANIGNDGKAYSSGENGISLNTGDFGWAVAAGARGIAVTTGERSMAVAAGEHGTAIANGQNAMVGGRKGAFLICAEHKPGENGRLLDIQVRKVDGAVIREDMLYCLQDVLWRLLKLLMLYKMLVLLQRG